MTLAPAAPGTARVVAGRYVLGEAVGRGGMGRVYRAHDRLLDRDVAVKLLYSDAVGDGELGRACATEARAAGRLAHEGVARVYDAGIDDGCLFVVMELVQGETLASRFADGTRPRIRDAVALTAQVADALDHAHECGVVHCDVKPANILVTAKGRTKLVDFGIAHAATVTGTLSLGELRGSAPYISPEQVRGEPVDGRSDVYALGAVLFELLAGRPPFEGANVATIMAQRLVADPPPLRALNPAVPPSLDRIVRKALIRNPAQRYQTAADLAADLWTVLPALPEIDAPPPSVAQRVGRLAGSAGEWLGGRAGALSQGLDWVGATAHARTTGGTLAMFEPAIVTRLAAVCSAMEQGRAGRLTAGLGNGIGARLAAVSRSLDLAGAGLHERPPRARLAAGRASVRATARATRARAATWAMRAVAMLARAAAQARSASVRAGLAARVALLVTLAMLARWTATSERHARRLAAASGARIGATFVASLAAASRGLDWAGAALHAHPPRACINAGRERLTRCAGVAGARTAGYLVAAADGLDRVEPVVRSTWERAHHAARRRLPRRREHPVWAADADRLEAWRALDGAPANRIGVERPFSLSRVGAGLTLEELEAELNYAFPDLDGAVEPSGRPAERRDPSEVPTLTRSRAR